MGMGPAEEQPMIIVSAHSQSEISAVRELFLEYAASLPFDLCFQDFDQEVRNLPGDYSPPCGCLLLAMADGQATGCVALRLFEPGIGEIKRLFVRPQFRGLGLGKKLAQAILEKARPLYERVRLDTTPTMTQAIALYESLGFRKIEAYRHNPIEGAVFLEIDLREC